MRLKILTLMIICITLLSISAQANTPDIVNGKARFNNNDMYFDVNPATLQTSGWVYVDFMNKQFGGNTDFAIGLLGTASIKEIQLWSNINPGNGTYQDWVSYSTSYQNFDFDGISDWYYITLPTLTQNNGYRVRFWLDISGSGKYDIALKPSASAWNVLLNPNSIYIDPWWDELNWTNDFLLEDNGTSTARADCVSGYLELAYPYTANALFYSGFEGGFNDEYCVRNTANSGTTNISAYIGSGRNITDAELNLDINLTTTDDYTFTAWARSTGSSTRDYLFGTAGSWFAFFTGASGGLACTAGKICMSAFPHGSEVISTDDFPTNNTWTHVVGIMDNTNQRFLIYINGVLSANATSDDFAAPQDGLSNALSLGETDSTNRWSGDADEVSVYDRKLTDSEISDLYNNGIGRVYADTAGRDFYSVINTSASPVNVFQPNITCSGTGTCEVRVSNNGGSTWSKWLSPADNGDLILLAAQDDQVQYQVNLTGNATTTPILQSLGFFTTQHVTNITSCQELQDNPSLNMTGSYQLLGDIDCSTVNGDGIFIPIGTNANSFNGTFNGNNYTISNLLINNTASNDYQGIFARIAEGATSSANISDLFINDCTITGSTLATSGDYIGCLAGYAYRVDLFNVHVNNTNISGGTFTGSLVGYMDGYLGGNPGLIPNSMYLSVENAYVVANSTVGALFGAQGAGDTLNTLNIQNLYGSGTVIGSSDCGGLIGANTDTMRIQNSYFTGNVTCFSGSNTGGLVGDFSGSINTHVLQNWVSADVTNVTGIGYCFGFRGLTTDNNFDSDVCDFDIGSAATGFTTSQMYDIDTWLGQNFDVNGRGTYDANWIIDDGFDYPLHRFTHEFNNGNFQPFLPTYYNTPSVAVDVGDEASMTFDVEIDDPDNDTMTVTLRDAITGEVIDQWLNQVAWTNVTLNFSSASNAASNRILYVELNDGSQLRNGANLSIDFISNSTIDYPTEGLFVPTLGNVSVNISINANRTCNLLGSNQNQTGLDLDYTITNEFVYLASNGTNTLDIVCSNNYNDSVSFTACIPVYSCSSLSTCNGTFRICSNTTDANNCGLPFAGDLSDFDVACTIPINATGALTVPFVTGTCPENTPSVLMFGIVTVICLVFLVMGLNIGIFGIFGAFLLMIMSWFIVGCFGLIGYILAVSSFVLLIWYALRGGGKNSYSL